MSFWRPGRTCGVLACDMRCSAYQPSINTPSNDGEIQRSCVHMQGVLQPSRWMPGPVHLLAQYFHPPRPPRTAHCTCLSSSAPSTMTVPRSTITSQHPTHFNNIISPSCFSAPSPHHSFNPLRTMPPTMPRKRRGKHPPAADDINDLPPPSSTQMTRGEADTERTQNHDMLLKLGAVSYLDCLVFLLLLAPQLLWHVGPVATASCALLAVPFLGSPPPPPPLS